MSCNKAFSGSDSAGMNSHTPEQTFAADVIKGLSGNPKYLPSKYLYDSRGDEIFQQIMELPEYYLTRCEEEILRQNKNKLLEHIRQRGNNFHLAELGAGDGKKTKILLSHFLKAGATFSYLPVDISEHALNDLCSCLKKEFPRLKVRGIVADYAEAMERLSGLSAGPKLVLFMGGNIGNFSKEEAAALLSLLATKLNKGDMLLAGFDLKKDPAIIYHAYNDKRGVTRSFNFNLLRRINRELGGNFNPDLFVHYPTYDPVTGAMKSYLIAERAHQVYLEAAATTFSFDAWEPIFMEVSNKYSRDEIARICKAVGFETEETFYDRKGYYTNVLLSKK